MSLTAETPRVEVKQATGGLDYFGPGSGYTAPHALYRLISDDDRRGCWYSSYERAAHVWGLLHPDTNDQEELPSRADQD